MVEPGEMVLSDVHARRKPTTKKTTPGIDDDDRVTAGPRTRFPFRVRSGISSRDRDGPWEDDYCDSDVVVIEHSLQTTLKEVGLQVWNGCLLLADYFLTHPNVFERENEIWLELGAGTGLCSIVAALSSRGKNPPKTILCTDTGEKVLDLCRRNLRENLSLLRDRDVETNLAVAEINFFNYDEGDDDSRVDFYDAEADQLERVALLPMMKRASVIFAADVVFDADVTEAFFRCVIDAMTSVGGDFPRKRLFVALERRVVFCLDDAEEPSSPIYDHFLACLEGLLEMTFDNGKFTAEKIDIDFPQCFRQSYERSDYLELWAIEFRMTSLL